MKRGWGIALGLVALILGGGVFVLLRGEAVLRETLVEEGSDALGIAVGLRGLSLSPLSGRIKVEGLSIGEPPGFGDAPLLEMAEASVRLDPRALFDDPATIDRIAIRGLRVRFIWRAGRNNLSDLERRLARLAPPVPSGGQETEDRTVRIRELHLRDIRVGVSGEMPLARGVGGTHGPASVERTLALADFTLTDIGGEKGVPPREALRLALQALVPQIEKAARSSIAKTAKRKWKQKVKRKALDGLRGLLGGKRGPTSSPSPQGGGPDDNGG